MRIVGGRWRGRRLAEVGAGDGAAQLRPTTDRARETIFNILANGRFGNLVDGARILDMFAGTGALGLEALSRGARRATFVDTGTAARAILRRNIALCAAQGIGGILRRDATDLGRVRGEPYDLAFLDPPYGRNLGEAAVRSALDGGWLRAGAWLLWEGDRAPAIPPSLVLRDRRQVARSIFSLLQVA